MSRKSVLVVEDEPLIRTDAMDLVGDAGFTVYEAADARKAVELLETKPDIGVLFTDIHMPGEMDGLDLARLVKQRWPHVAIIIVSGHAKPTSEELPDDGLFFSKPYLRSAILRALKRAEASS